jgi:hypothetical protein
MASQGRQTSANRIEHIEQKTKNLLTLSTAEFSHPFGGSARLRTKAAGETEHGECSRRLTGWACSGLHLLQPCQQLACARFVQLLYFLDHPFDCAHTGTVSLPMGIANEAATEFFSHFRSELTGGSIRRIFVLMLSGLAGAFLTTFNELENL